LLLLPQAPFWGAWGPYARSLGALIERFEDAAAAADAHRAVAGELAARQASSASGTLRERFVARPDVADLLD
jgi:hypothetical protein